MTNQIIIDQVSRRLRDVTRKTWKLDILIASMNSAFQSVINVRPDSNTVHRNMSLVKGHEQQIDDDLYKLVHVLHNVDPATGNAKRAITKANMGTMDSVFMHWRQDKPRGYVEHYMLDDFDDRKFYIWPPVIGREGEAPIVPEALEDPGPLTEVVPIGIDPLSVPSNFITNLDSANTTIVGPRSSASINVHSSLLNTSDGEFYAEFELLNIDDAFNPFALAVGLLGQTSVSSVSFLGFSNDQSIGYLGNSNIAFEGDNDFQRNNPLASVVGIVYRVQGSNRSVDFYADNVFIGSFQLEDSVDFRLGITVARSSEVKLNIQSSDFIHQPPGDSQPWYIDDRPGIVTQQDIDDFNESVIARDTAIQALNEFNAQPGGEMIRIVGALVPCITEEDLPNEVPLNKTHHPAIMEWMLYYCYAVDDERTANAGRPDFHFRNFFNLMDTKIKNSMRIQEIREMVDS